MAANAHKIFFGRLFAKITAETSPWEGPIVWDEIALRFNTKKEKSSAGSRSNYRNGHTKKKIHTNKFSLEIDSHWDRHGSFVP